MQKILAVLIVLFAAVVSGGPTTAPTGVVSTGTTQLRRFADRFADAMSIADFGARGDGTTDDTSAINAATLWSVNNNNACVRLLAGKTYIGAALLVRGCIVGPGMSQATIKQKAGSTSFFSTVGGTGTVTGFTLHGVTLNGNASNVSGGFCLYMAGTWSALDIHDVRFTNCYYRNVQLEGTNADVTNNTQSIISNCRIDHSGNAGGTNAGFGMGISAGNNLTVKFCEVDNNLSHGIAVVANNNDPATVQMRHLKFIGNTFHHNVRDGLTVASFNASTGVFSSVAGPGPHAAYVVIADNESYSNGEGMGFDGQYGTVTGNIIHDNTVTGMLANSVDTVISNNIIYNNGSFGIDAGGCQRCKISGNRIDNNSADGSMGIDVGAAIDTVVSDNEFSGNGGQQIQAGISDNGDCIGSPCTYSTTAFPYTTARLTIERNTVTITGSHNGININSGSQAIVRNNTCILGLGSGGDSAQTKCYVLNSTAVDNDNNIVVLNSNGQSTPIIVASASTMVIPDGGIDFSVSGTTAISTIRTKAQDNQSGKVIQVVVDTPGAMTTSSDSLTIGTGTQSLGVAAGLSLTPTHTIRIGTSAAPVKYMEGTVTSYDNATGDLVVNVTSVSGSGTFSSWTVGIPSDVSCAVSGGGGTGAVFYPNMDGNGALKACLATSGGSGYTSVPSCTVSGGGLIGATCHALLGVSNNLGRTIKLTFANTSVVVKTGGNINLASGVNYFSSTSGWLVLKGDGAGNWNEVSRSGAPATVDNRIVNPCMYVDQRNEGAALPTQQGFVADQWWAQQTTGAFYSAQQVIVPSASNDPSPDCGSYIKFTVTGSASPAPSALTAVYQSIRGGLVADLGYGTTLAKSLVLDFCARSSVSATYSWALHNINSVRSYLGTYTVTANTPQCFSFVIPGDTSGSAFLNTSANANGMRLAFDLGSGSNSANATAGQWLAVNGARVVTGADAFASKPNGTTLFLSGVRLYPGTQDLAWAKRPYDAEIEILRQYYRKTFNAGTAPAQNAGLTGAICVQNPIANGQPSTYWAFNPPMVKAPTVTTYNPSAANANWRDVTANADVAVWVDPNTALGLGGVNIATAAPVTTLADNLCIHAAADAVFNF